MKVSMRALPAIVATFTIAISMAACTTMMPDPQRPRDPPPERPRDPPPERPRDPPPERPRDPNPGQMPETKPGAPGGGAGACNAAAISWAVGQQASSDNLQRATLESGALSARVIGPGMAGTMEFNPDRLTVTTDATGRIVNVSCN